ncbi:hypothetical protein F5I97DRAFT_1928542 [Phlebopus sp. FC_14]|nr:hypothetical protein F5I97DRAFT_1928542 [Phlebopus sp. FC_14]
MSDPISAMMLICANKRIRLSLSEQPQDEPAGPSRKSKGKKCHSTTSKATRKDSTMDVNTPESPTLNPFDTMYCCFCKDALGPIIHKCKGYRALICEQGTLHGMGCVRLGSMDPTIDFMCSHCHHRYQYVEGARGSMQGRLRPLHCNFEGYSTRTYTKINWPMVVIIMFLASLVMKDVPDTHIADSIANDL